MNRTSAKVKAIINYIATVISWSLFVILIFCACFLCYYFIRVKLYEVNGEEFKPPFTIYTIVSPSMYDTIKVYDVIVNKTVNDPAEIGVGDIITFISSSSITNGMTITHRVKSIERQGEDYLYETKGDNNAVSDPAKAYYSNIIGKVFMVIPQVGRVQFFVASKTGWIVVVIIPALIVIIKDIIKIIRLNKIRKSASIDNRMLVKAVENNEPMPLFVETKEDPIIISRE